MWSIKELSNEFALRGVNVLYRKMHFWAGILVKVKGQWLCYINARYSPAQQRWTLAHELGHIVLHRHQGLLFTDGIFSVTEEDAEWQANRYASEILMPPESVSVVLDATLPQQEKVRRTSQEFEVPAKMAAWWLLELGYIGRKCYNSHLHELQNGDNPYLET